MLKSFAILHSFFLFDDTHHLDKSEWLKIICVISQPKTYVVGTQKNRLNEMVLLSTLNIYKNLWIRKHSQLYAKFSISSYFPAPRIDTLWKHHYHPGCINIG